MVNGVDGGSRVKRREIVETDLEALAELLAKGFPGRPSSYWRRGLSRMGERPRVTGCARYGYLLETEAGPVGVILLLFNEDTTRGESRIRCNASSWYAEPAYRMHAALLIASALKRCDVTFINVSPAVRTWSTVEAQGFSVYAAGMALVFPALARSTEPATVEQVRAGRVVDCEPAEAALLGDHAAYGCTSLLVKADDGPHPFVFLPFRIRAGRLPLPFMQLIYCRAEADFRRFAAPLGRALLCRGMLGVVLDDGMPLDGLVGLRYRGYGRKYVRGPDRPRLGDLAYTERVIFGS